MVSSGFMRRFEKRHNIRSMVEHGERASAEQNGATKFVEDFKDVRKLYTLDQLFSLTKLTGLYFGKLPGWTLTTADEVQRGRRIVKTE